MPRTRSRSRKPNPGLSGERETKHPPRNLRTCRLNISVPIWHAVMVDCGMFQDGREAVCWHACAPIRQNYVVTERGPHFLAPPVLQKCNREVTFLSLSTCYFANVRFLIRSRLTHSWVAYVANRKHGAMFISVSLVTEVTK